MTKFKQLIQPEIILVADRTLSADYRILFEGMFATMQTTRVPEWLMRRLTAPPVATDPAGRAAVAPLGLRRIEASLVAETGLRPEKVACTTPERLPELLGPWVKIVAVSSSDPLGRGMSNSTAASFWPGELYTRHWTERMMQQLRRRKADCGFRVVAGGAGAWQYQVEPEAVARHGIDCVFNGYFEEAGPPLFARLLAGENAPAQVTANGTAAEKIRPIRAPSLLGIVEISRGCGKGCRFCTMASLKMAHLPPATILADLQTNLAGGARAVVLGSEDFLRYGSRDWKPAPDKLLALLEQVQALPGLPFVQVDHANISSVAQYSDDQLQEIRRLIAGSRPARYPWLNLGVESADGNLVQANSPGKIAPFRPEDWAEMVLTAADRLERAGWFPIFSVILGLPGETPESVARTRALVRRLAQRPAVVFPVFYEPLPQADGLPDARFRLEGWREDHYRLYTECYETNFRWVPKLFADNQRAGGVPWPLRAFLQVMGRGEILAWRWAFARLRRKLRGTATAD